jgi:hypothetical protein
MPNSSGTRPRRVATRCEDRVGHTISHLCSRRSSHRGRLRRHCPITNLFSLSRLGFWRSGLAEVACWGPKGFLAVEGGELRLERDLRVQESQAWGPGTRTRSPPSPDSKSRHVLQILQINEAKILRAAKTELPNLVLDAIYKAESFEITIHRLCPPVRDVLRPKTKYHIPPK